MKAEHSAGARQPSKPEKPREIKHDPKRPWDRVDEAGWESFPASDPPAHWAGHDKEPPPTLNGEEAPEEEDED